MLKTLGRNGEYWVKNTWGQDGFMCLHGAIRRCQPQPGDAYLVEQVARRQGWGTDWNDDEHTHWGDVRERIARIEITDIDLADTFGPQWEQVVALVRRAAVLTADEVYRLAAMEPSAGPDTHAAARAAARSTVRYAAVEAGEDATWGAVWGACVAARADARGVASNTAEALVARDLIGQHGFTQEHYDTLTRSWRTVIGPVHPDDKP